MRAKDVGLLRSLIREMVNEAPYQSSQRVVLQPVRAPGLNVGVLLQGVGLVVLISTYKWLDDFVKCDNRLETFPIFQTLISEQKAKTFDTWDPAQSGYNNTLDDTPSSGTSEPSDLVRVMSLYLAIQDAVKMWPAGTEWAAFDNRSKAAYVAAFIKVLSKYSGCPEALIKVQVGEKGENMPPEMQTRDGAFKFFEDTRNDSHESFVRGLTQQSDSLKSKFDSQKADIKAFFDDKMRIEDGKYKAVKIK